MQPSPFRFFALVFALTVPFWVFGGRPLPIPVRLPASAAALVTPMLAALILTHRRGGWAGVRQLFSRVLDFRRMQNRAWLAPVLLLNPVIYLLAYAAMRLAGRPLPDPQVPWLLAPVFLLAFFAAAVGEELGWMGCACEPLEARWGALRAGLLLGGVWAVFHLVPDLQNEQTAGWIFWHRLTTVSLRVLIVWVYNNTGKSLFSALLFHAMSNVCWTLFPNYGSHYDPLFVGALTLLATAAVLIIYEPRTLARLRFGG